MKCTKVENPVIYKSSISSKTTKPLLAAGFSAAALIGMNSGNNEDKLPKFIRKILDFFSPIIPKTSPEKIVAQKKEEYKIIPRSPSSTI